MLHETFCKLEPKLFTVVEKVAHRKREVFSSIKAALNNGIASISPKKSAAKDSTTTEVVPQNKATAPKLEPQTFRTLLVDGSSANLDIMSSSMEALEQELTTATNGLEAVIEYKKVKGDIDIIFMDLQMLIMDGIEAAVEIRKYESENGISPTAIVAMTNASSVSPIAKHEAYSRGMNAYLMKPIGQTAMKEILIMLRDNGRHALNEFE